jgi:hypothetical protein
MICYTLSDCVLSYFLKDTINKQIPSLLWRFVDGNNSHKLILDREGKMIDCYLEFAKDNHIIENWLEYMGHTPTSWELIDVENLEKATSNQELFLMVCSQTEDKMLIVHSHNGWTKGKYYHKRNILYNDTGIRILDRNEAITLLSSSEEKASESIVLYSKDWQQPMIQTTTITDSIVAIGGSHINNSQIKQK